jgi:hypothetical protein
MMNPEHLIELGAIESGSRLYLHPSLRKTHMHVLGASGRGKSFFLENMIRQDIVNRDGLCLIDPHGSLYHKIVSWCTEHAHLVSWDRLVLLDASAAGWTFGFNPLNFAGADTSYSVDCMVNACAQVWGGEDTSSTPLLKRVLRSVFHALAEKNLTLLEAAFLINERDELRAIRKVLTEDLNDPVIREQWEKWNVLTPRELREQFASTTNRLMEFLAAQVIRTIVGQRNVTIDLRKIMDEGGVVLVNLESRGRLSDFNARTLGTLITNDLFLKAQGRPTGSRPFYLYIDECGRYLNESIQRILDESRKRGLHLILANQHLAQLRAAGETVYKAIMTDAQTKVIFGGLATEDAETMVKEVFLDLNLQEPKDSLTRRAAVGQEKIILKGGSSGQSTTTGRSTSQGTTVSVTEGVGYSVSESESEAEYADGSEGSTTHAWGVHESASSGETQSTSESSTESFSESISEMSSWAESFKTIYENVVGGLFSLEEQRYKKVAWLKKQPQQMALLVRPDYALIPFRVTDVREPLVNERMTGRFVEQRFRALPFVVSETESLAEIDDRVGVLNQLAYGDTKKPEDFDPWEE